MATWIKWAARINSSQDIFAPTAKLSHLGLNLDRAINCHSGLSEAGRRMNACAIYQMDIKRDAPSAEKLADDHYPTVYFAKSR